MTVKGTHRSANHQVAARITRMQPGLWTQIGVYPTPSSAGSISRHISRASLRAYAPAGSFEAYYAMVDHGHAVWARYVLGVDVEPMPETVTYRVVDRGEGPGYSGVRIVTVIVSPCCPECGGPRGKARPYRFCEDGEYYSCDQWTNLCGHIDPYAAVLKEWRSHPTAMARPVSRAPQLVGDGGPFAGAVAEIGAVVEGKRVHHAKQAAALIREAGHEKAADLITGELAVRRGHMSARQAMAFLTEQGAKEASK